MAPYRTLRTVFLIIAMKPRTKSQARMLHAVVGCSLLQIALVQHADVTSTSARLTQWCPVSGMFESVDVHSIPRHRRRKILRRSLRVLHSFEACSWCLRGFVHATCLSH